MSIGRIVSKVKTVIKKLGFYSREYRFHRSYSQYGEDLLLQGFLGEKWSWNYKGFWVDIGAHHPSNLSNTKAFSINGWRGINVDASSEAISLFNRNRKRDINVNVGIGLEPGDLDYYRMASSPMNTFSKELAYSMAMRGTKIVEVVKVPVITMKELLDTKLPQGQHIDFLSIDCEGMDFDVLRSNDWSLYRPDYILVEIYTEDKNWLIPSCPITQYLNERGYEFVGQGCMTTFYKRVR